MWSFFIHNSRFSYLLMVALIGFGLYSVVTIPKENAPEIQIPVGVVTTSLPGAAALDVESLITNELERAIDTNVDNVRQITSSSRESLSSITVEFDANADIPESIRSLRDAVDNARSSLPDSATDPVVSDVDFSNQPVLSVAVSGNRNETEFINLAATIEDTLLDVTGVSRVEITGVREREAHVLVEQSALLQYGLTIQDIVQGIRVANQSVPVGEIVTNNIAYNVLFTGKIENPEAILDLSVANRGGQPVFVRDVARVIDGVSSASTLSRLSVEGLPSDNAIIINVFKQRNADIMTVSSATQTAFFKLGELPEYQDLTFHTLDDAGELIASELTQLATSGLQTAALVALLLIITLGWREGIMAGLAIPLSFTIGFIGLLLSGNTINFISLFALVLSIGILVDSSIVVVEGINKRMKQDPTIDKTDAALQTIAAFQSPIMAGTLTTVSVFAGLFVVSGIIGQFIASIPYTLIFILFASLLVALGFIPLLASSFLRRRSSTRIERAQVKYANQLETWYSKRLHSLLANRRKKAFFSVSLVVGFISAIALIPLGFVQVIFFGAGDADTINIQIETPVGSTTMVTDRYVRAIEEILYDIPEISSFRTTVGAAGMFGSETSGSSVASIFVRFDENRQRTSVAISDEIRDLTANFTDITVSVSQPDAGPPVGDPIGINIFGTDLQDISTTARDIADIIESIPGTINVTDGTDAGNTEFVFTLDSLQAARFGLTPLSVSQYLRSAVTGTEATTLTSLNEEIPVNIRLELNPNETFNPDFFNHTDITTLENLLIPTPAGDTVPLASVLDTRLQEARSVINHRDRERVVSVRSDITDTGNVREINVELIRRIESELTLPDGVSYALAGETEEADQGFAELGLALIVGIVLMIAVLVLQFNSFRYPIYVLSIVPFSLIGILYGLAIVGSPLSFPSIMGFIALTGIVVNNSILLIDVMNSYRRDYPDMTIREVVVSAAASRLRPILLTTITTVVGISPLLFSDPIWVPLATAIMFGLSFSVIITLILIPIIYDKFPGKLVK